MSHKHLGTRSYLHHLYIHQSERFKVSTANVAVSVSPFDTSSDHTISTNVVSAPKNDRAFCPTVILIPTDVAFQRQRCQPLFCHPRPQFIQTLLKYRGRWTERHFELMLRLWLVVIRDVLKCSIQLSATFPFCSTACNCPIIFLPLLMGGQSVELLLRFSSEWHLVELSNFEG